jgi:hypothetical protein
MKFYNLEPIIIQSRDTPNPAILIALLQHWSDYLFLGQPVMLIFAAIPFIEGIAGEIL